MRQQTCGHGLCWAERDSMEMKMRKSGYSRTRRRLSLIAALTATLLLSGCGRKGGQAPEDDSQAAGYAESGMAGEDKGAAAGESDGQNGSDETVGVDFEEYIEWAVPNLVEISDETVARFNQMLRERGFDFGLRLIWLDSFEYQSQLQNGEISPDIAFIGFNASGEADAAAQLIASGYFECLDSYLSGSGLYAAVAEQLWNSVKYKGSVYTIPSGAATDGGISIYFDLDKVSREEAEGFQGDITKLPDILGADGKLLYSVGQFQYASYFNCTYWSGTAVTQEGDVSSVFDNEDCMEWLRVMNQLFLSDRAASDEGMDWSVLVNQGAPAGKENVYCYSSKKVLNTRYSASTGIVSASENKEKAFRLLELLHTDSELGNCLVYGADHTEKDGFALDADGNVMNAALQKIVFGLNESVLWDQESAASIKYDSIQDKVDYYAQNVTESPIIGMTFETDTVPVNQILTTDVQDSLWKSRNLEEEIARLRTLLEETDLQQLIDEIKTALSEG